MEVAQANKTIEWDAGYNEDGSATGTLLYENPINTAEQVVLLDMTGGVFFVGYVTLVTRSDLGAGYQMELVDPLSGGLYSEVVFDEFPEGFPESFKDKAEVDAWCETHNLQYHYVKDGYYTFQTPAAAIPDHLIASRTVREGVNYDGYFNRIVVTGSAEKEIPAEIEEIETNANGVHAIERFQGDRMLYRHSSGDGWYETENWTWDDPTNVCVRYERDEGSLAPPAFRMDGVDRYNVTETVRTVPSFNEDMSEYRIHETSKTLEYAWAEFDENLAIGPIPPELTAELITAAKETVDIERLADGSGTKTINKEAAARGKYFVGLNLVISLERRPVYDSEGEITGYETVPLDNHRLEKMTFPAFGYNELVQDTREKTAYRRGGDRAYSFTSRYRPFLQVLTVPTPFDQDVNAKIVLISDGGEYGSDEPELPEMEEAVGIISAEVEYAEDGDTHLGVYERHETLPDIPIPDGIMTSEDLYDWLYERATQYAAFKKKNSMLIDEMTIETTLNADIEVGCALDAYTVISVRHSLGESSARTTIVATKPSAQTVPRRGQITTGALIMAAMKKNGAEHDNIGMGVVVKPVSSRSAIADINGATYKVSNPNGGPLFAGDRIPVYRATGRSMSGRMANN
ncbi:MAG: hypothetical protein LBS53_14090 [Synergistaceae bacterium]|jgi:hypothetical protein|nr:hypothetical protein [Synergistaceae bacterium]